MVGKEADTGDTGAAVAANVTRLRGDMSYTQLSSRLEERAGWSINAVGIRRIESGERRVTVDDLVALAVALGVSPVTLLMPNTETGDEEVGVTGMADSVTAMTLWRWLMAELPMQGDRRIPIAFQLDARPEWWWQHQAEKEERDHLERRAADRNLVESGFMSAEEPLAEGKSPDGDN